MRASSYSYLLALGLCLAACSGEPGETPSTTTATTTTTSMETGCKADADCAGTPETPLCEVATGACTPLPPGFEIGFKDGSPGSVAFVSMFEPDKPRQPTDLAFNADKPEELWVVNRQDDSVIIIQKPGAPDSTWERRRDPAAAHFMDRPMAIAWGATSATWGPTWGVCGDSNNGGDYFMGPALMPANLDIFAKPTPTGLGSHLDMLHSTSYCRGIAHVEANVYWVFNSHRKALDRYDFREDHGPGNDDHSDGEILRYATDQVLGAEGIPSHLFYHPDDKHLYVADTGNKRVVKLDTTSGSMGNNFSGLEPVKLRKMVDGAVLTEVVPPGMLEAPSGIEIHGGLIYVTDHATSRFHVFDLTGKLLRSLDTGKPPGSLAGFVFGPDGKIYFTDLLDSRVYRIDPLF